MTKPRRDREADSAVSVDSRKRQSGGTNDAASFATKDGARDEGSGLHRLLVESVQDYAIFALDTHGTVLSWSAGAQQLKGYTANEIIGKNFSTFYPPEDIARGKPAWELKCAVTDGRVEDEGWRIRKDGSLFWANVVITALRDEQGELVGFAKVTRDLTERRKAEDILRQSEEKFRTIVQSVRDYAILMLDTKGCIASWNLGAERIKGYNADEIIGRHFSVFYPEPDLVSGKPARELEVAAREGRFEDENWRVRKDGTFFWANVIITALHNSHNELIGYVKVTRDLTDRRAAEQRAIGDARRIAEVESSNRAKTEFLAAMSHELRTPLNAIGGYAELMEMGVSGTITEQQREYLERIRGSQQHLLGIINDLLNYSRIESGQVTYELDDVKLGNVVESVVDMMSAQAKLKKIEIECAPCPEGTIARADRLKVEQIVLNLLSNAVKFEAPGGKVTAACGHSGDRVFIQVTDTGPGIPEDKHQAIFEPFVQLGRTLSSAHEGTGLGLAISRDLARAMHGDVTVESTPGQGATFRLSLPKA